MTVRIRMSQAVFEGAVVLTRGTLVVYSDRMVVSFRSQDQRGTITKKRAEAGKSPRPRERS